MGKIKIGRSATAKNILLTLIMIAVVFLISEVAVRLLVIEESYIIDNKTKKRGFYDSVVEQKPYGKQLKPNINVTVKNHHINHQDVNFVTNSFGIRGAAFNPDDPAYKKVLFIGDSVTLENYLPADQTFIGILKKELYQQGLGNLLLLNGGIWDVGIQEEYHILKEKSESIKPDIVILDFYMNDSRPSWGFEREGRLNFLKYLQHSRIISYIYNRLAVRDFLNRQGLLRENFRFGWVEMAKEDRWRSNEQGFMELVQGAGLDWGAAWDDHSWIIVKEYLSKMKGISKREGFKLAVICFPVSFQVEADFVMGFPQDRLRTVCNELGIEFLDLLPCMRMYNSTRLFYDHCHLNPVGNEVSAKCIKGFLERLLNNSQL